MRNLRSVTISKRCSKRHKNQLKDPKTFSSEFIICLNSCTHKFFSNLEAAIKMDAYGNATILWWALYALHWNPEIRLNLIQLQKNCTYNFTESGISFSSEPLSNSGSTSSWSGSDVISAIMQNNKKKPLNFAMVKAWMNSWTTISYIKS